MTRQKFYERRTDHPTTGHNRTRFGRLTIATFGDWTDTREWVFGFGAFRRPSSARRSDAFLHLGPITLHWQIR
jgi:hypothetical protein